DRLDELNEVWVRLVLRTPEKLPPMASAGFFPGWACPVRRISAVSTGCATPASRWASGRRWSNGSAWNRTSESRSLSHDYPSPDMKVRLADIAHARSGDKADWVDF